MAFVHSLVKAETNGKIGWHAPLELGEDTSLYISFVIPVIDRDEFFNKYTCEVITSQDGERRVRAHDLIKRGKASFAIRLGNTKYWFTVRPCPRHERELPYIGKLEHEDFRYAFTEIEPEDPDMLDVLYDGSKTFIIGCEPFAHYARINELADKR